MELNEIIETIREELEEKNEIRDRAYKTARETIRLCGEAIHAIHRGEVTKTKQLLKEVKKKIRETKSLVEGFPHLMSSGLIAAACQEFAEARIMVALLENKPLPSPAKLEISPHPYLMGLADAVGELRRYALDLLRQGAVNKAEEIMGFMEEAYTALMSIDYPKSIVPGLRRKQDIVRGTLEKTRGDLTTAIRQQKLEESLKELEGKLK